MRKIILSSMLLPWLAFSQQVPTGFGINGVGANANTFWARGGNTFGTTGNNLFGTMWNSPIYTYTDGINHMTMLGTITTPYERSGFVGLNNSSPRFNLDITTPEPDGNTQYGELLLRARTADDTNAYISFVNLTTAGIRFNPALLGRQSDNNLPALSTVGSIFSGQDIITNLQPITRFMSGINYDPATGALGLAKLNTVASRRIFGWYNGGDLLMVKQANGYLGIGTQLPGNRVEINSDFYDETTGNAIVAGSLADTTFATNNGFGGTGYSGLRFTNLRSTSTPQTTNPGSGVLALDANGDVIYVPAGGDGADGTDGIDGTDGLNMLTINNPLAPNTGGCINGGVFLQFGLDANNNGVLEAGEINPALNQTICNGLNGAPGPMGPQGPAGSVVTADNGLTMSTPTNVQLGGTLIRYTSVDQNNFDMEFLNHGRFSIGGNTTSTSKLTLRNTNNGLSPYANIFSAIDDNNKNVFNIDKEGNVVAEATSSSNNTFIDSYKFTTLPNSLLSPSILTGIRSNFLPVDIAGSTYVGFYTNPSNTSGNNKGFEAVIEGKYVDGLNYGIRTHINNGFRNFGGFFQVGSYGTSKQSMGVYVEARGDDLVHGAKIVAGSATEVYGIHVSAGLTVPGGIKYAGYFNGDVHVTGQLSITNGPTLSSDQMFKTNINSIPNALEKINALQPHTYNYDTINFADFSFESDQQMGLIAQEVEQVLPTLVSSHKRPAQRDSLGNVIAPEISYKGVEYEEIIPLLVAGMQEQQTQIQTQEEQIQSKDSIISDLKDELTDVNARLTQLENCLSALLPTLCSMNQEAIQQNNNEQQKEYEKTLDKARNSQTENSELRSALEVRLSDKNAIILSQNVPNPFAEMTTIKYNIPTSVKEAQIHFYTNKGIIINSVDIVERGNGEIRVFAEDLSSGLYTYSLVADGKVVATKKMLKN